MLVHNVAANLGVCHFPRSSLLADSQCFRSGVCEIASFCFTNAVDRTFDGKLPAKVARLKSSHQSNSLLSKVSDVTSDIAPYTLKLTKAYPKDVYSCSTHLHLRPFKSLYITRTSARTSMQSQLHKILFPRRLSDTTCWKALRQHRV
jgi:hypothetical protein